jgi:hypothetical protein
MFFYKSTKNGLILKQNHICRLPFKAYRDFLGGVSLARQHYPNPKGSADYDTAKYN